MRDFTRYLFLDTSKFTEYNFIQIQKFLFSRNYVWDVTETKVSHKKEIQLKFNNLIVCRKNKIIFSGFPYYETTDRKVSILKLIKITNQDSKTQFKNKN